MARLKSGSVKKTTTVLVTSVDLASADVTGVLPVANGGTGSGSYTDGQLLIGNTASGNTLTKATLTAGSGISITNGGGSITIASSGGGLTNWSESAGTYSSKDWKRFYPVSGTNVNAVFSPLGTGSIQAHVADGTSTGGNQRGSNAVDWQTSRNAAAQVASGINAVLAGGLQNKASGDYSTVSGGWGHTGSGSNAVIGGGAQNTASGTTSGVMCGGQNTASGSNSVVMGGLGGAASGDYSVILGGQRATTRTLYGMAAFASGRFATSGDAQLGLYVLRCLTTNGTATVLTANQSAAANNNQIVLPNNSAYTFKAMVTSHRTDAVSGYTHRASWMVDGIALRDANAASTLVSATINTIYNTPGWTLAVATDTTNGCVKFTFTGEASKTIRTVAVVETCEVTS